MWRPLVTLVLFLRASPSVRVRSRLRGPVAEAGSSISFDLAAAVRVCVGCEKCTDVGGRRKTEAAADHHCCSRPPPTPSLARLHALRAFQSSATNLVCLSPRWLERGRVLVGALRLDWPPSLDVRALKRRRAAALR